MKQLFLIIVLAALAACSAGTARLVGNDRDAHGCIGSAGYRWDATRQACVRPWEIDK